MSSKTKHSTQWFPGQANYTGKPCLEKQTKINQNVDIREMVLELRAFVVFTEDMFSTQHPRSAKDLLEFQFQGTQGPLLAVVAHAFNPNIWEAETGGSL